jgi:hypothetical protein
MSEPFRPSLSFCTAVVGVALILQQGCRDNDAIREEDQISWVSPKMREIERRWHSIQDAYDKTPEKIPGEGKTKWQHFQDLLERLFRKDLCDRELRKLAGAATTAPEGLFANDAVEFMARRFVDLGDRDSLLKLLSARCPGRVGGGAYNEFEFYLVYRGKRLNDPILILGEAYSKCHVPATRHAIAAAVRRAFGGLGISGTDETDYVNNAMQWYQKEKEHLGVNPNYWRNEMLVPLEDYERNPRLYEGFPPPVKRELLFERKAVSEKK